MSHPNAGYHDCPCRDCFEVAIGCDEDGTPHLCHECEGSGCDAEGESECVVISECDEVHLLKTRGGSECGLGGDADADINRVTCRVCLQAHDSTAT